MKPDKGNNKKNAFGLISLILWALMLTLLFRSCSSSYANSNQVQVDYSVFRQWVVAELVQEVHMESGVYTITLKEGMEEEAHFSEIVIHGGLDLDVDRMRGDVLSAGEKLRQKAKGLRAVIFECSNLASYSADLGELLEVPVFDTLSAANLAAYAVNPPRYL